MLQTSRSHVAASVKASFTSTRRWALALRPEHHAGRDRSGHVEQPACRTRCSKEPHAQRSWHLQRSPPAQSEDLPPEVWLAESLRRRAARRGARAIARLGGRSRPKFAVGNRGVRSKFRSQTAVVDRGLRLKARRADRGSRSSAPNFHHKVAVGRGANHGGAVGSPTESAGRKRGRRDRTFGPKTRHGPL